MYRCGALFPRLSRPTSRAVECGKSGNINKVGSKRGYGDVPFKPPTMSDLPQPQGSWAQHNARIQRKYNLQLAAGVGFSAFTLFFAKQSGLINFGLAPGKVKFPAAEPAADASEEEEEAATPVEEEEAAAEAAVEPVETPAEPEPTPPPAAPEAAAVEPVETSAEPEPTAPPAATEAGESGLDVEQVVDPPTSCVDNGSVEPVVEETAPTEPEPVVEEVAPTEPEPVVEDIAPTEPEPVVAKVAPTEPEPVVAETVTAEPVIADITPAEPVVAETVAEEIAPAEPVVTVPDAA
ncbi:hypothetical protein Pcinc_038848 [Petrolisthes cinctipes]|uniref:Deltamethrin resistance protein prag01 domain-containing protein n=1 Tax=Petrolisthes cinctipes TaxID=88211 RepID=A0AAE1EL68_PETCI|nr:hypothetical protein Pcinc_038848 [Petrolisthes cinctipes]